MTNEEFAEQAIEILNARGCRTQICGDKETIYMGAYSYMRRHEIVEASEELLKLEGYTIVKEVRKEIEVPEV